MKTMISALLILCCVGGLQAVAETTAVAADNEGAVNSQPLTEEPVPAAKKPADSQKKRNIRDRLFFGGYINLSFGSYTVIGLEPMLGYRVTPKFSTGVKVRYNYIQDDRYAKSYTTSTYGGSVFGRYYVTPKFYAQGELASYNYETFYIGGGSERDWVPFVLMGGGYTQPLGERTWLNVEILFDVLQDDGSPYEDWEPFFSIGIGAGI